MGGAADDALMKLNVSGEVFVVLRSALAALPGPLASIAEGQIPVTKDDSGNPYVDYDAELFPYVLNYLRRKFAFLPSDFSQWERLKAEFDFLTLPFPEDAAALKKRQEEESRLAKKKQEEAAKETRKRARGPTRVSLNIVNYGEDELIGDHTRNFVKLTDVQPVGRMVCDGIKLVAKAAAHPGLKKDSVHVCEKGSILEVIGISTNGNYITQSGGYEPDLPNLLDKSMYSQAFARLGSWLEGVESADLRISRTFGPSGGGWWEIDGKVCRTPAVAVTYLTSRGFREEGRFANGNSQVVTFARDP